MSDDRHGPNPPDTDPGEGARWARCHKPGWQTASGRDGWRWEPVDLGVADIVERLQGDDMPFTVGACDGHGCGLGEITLTDGRTLVVHPEKSDRHRGHAIEQVVPETWVYADTRQPVPENPQRPCGFCGLADTPEGHDGCLGTLPGVRNACCGHGDPECAYVQFDDCTRVGGPGALAEMLRLKASSRPVTIRCLGDRPTPPVDDP